MGMATILFNGTEPFEKKNITILSIEGLMSNLVKIVQAASEQTFKDFTILYIYIANEQGQITPKGQNCDGN